jgi:hypothetical protein
MPVLNRILRLDPTVELLFEFKFEKAVMARISGDRSFPAQIRNKPLNQFDMSCSISFIELDAALPLLLFAFNKLRQDFQNSRVWF